MSVECYNCHQYKQYIYELKKDIETLLELLPKDSDKYKEVLSHYPDLKLNKENNCKIYFVEFPNREIKKIK